jgi:MFS family permease
MSFIFMLQNVGAGIGVYLWAVFAQRYGRKLAFMVSFALAWVSVLIFVWSITGSGSAAFGRALFLAPLLGFGTLGPFSGYTVYFPELYPTRLRATGCGFCYNAARVLAAFGPYALGGLAAVLATYDASGAVVKSGYAPAATIVASIYILGFVGAALGPETRGKPLPE